MRFEEKINTVVCNDTLRELKTFPDESIDMVITSPPYYGLRDYGEEAKTIWGGDPNCEFDEQGFCKKCGAWYGQLGLEPTPELYLEHLKQIAIELKRVLKKTGTIWWNMGDTYGGSMQGYGVKDPNYIPTRFQDVRIQNQYPAHSRKPPQYKILPKCLLMIPERFALMMIDIGFILRNKIIWYKPNHMPSSAKDRFTNTWEYVFLFSKSKKYYFDLDAVRVPHEQSTLKRIKYHVIKFGGGSYNPLGKFGKMKMGAEQTRIKLNPLGKNPGDVIYSNVLEKGGSRRFWEWQLAQGKFTNPKGKNPGDFWEIITTQPFKGAHFAVFPEKLCEIPIKVGCPKDGILLDPFCGSGTALVVAKKLGRKFIGIDIKKEYCEMARARLEKIPEKLDKFIGDKSD